MSKQDRIYPRTPAQLEIQYQFGKTFAELMGVATDAQTHAQQAEESVNEIKLRVDQDYASVWAELNMKVDMDDYGQIVSMINASADVIELNSNRLIINSDYFTLDADGTIKATAGEIGDCELLDGKLIVKKLETKSDSVDTFDVCVDNYGAVIQDMYYGTIITSGSLSMVDKSTGAYLVLSPTGLALGTTVLTESQLKALLALI